MKKIVVLILICGVIFFSIYFAITLIPNNKGDRHLNNATESTNTNKEFEVKMKNKVLYNFIPKKLKKVNRISYLSDVPTYYNIENYEDFLINLCKDEWQEYSGSIKDEYYYDIELIGDTTVNVKLSKELSQQDKISDYIAYIKIVGNEFEKKYSVPYSILSTIRSYSNDKIQLYESSYSVPNESKCYDNKDRILREMDDKSKEYLIGRIRTLHSELENRLKVEFIDDSTDPAWKDACEKNTISKLSSDESGTVTTGWLQDDIDEIKYMVGLLKNQTMIEDFSKAQKHLKDASNQHSKLEIYYAYQIIHDYDLWVINYPPYHESTERKDYAGYNTYFGTVNELN